MTQLTVIRGGTVVDGTGAPGYAADVSIRSPNVFAVSLFQYQSIYTQATLSYNYATASATTVPEPSTFLPILLLAGFGALRLRGTGGTRVRQ